MPSIATLKKLLTKTPKFLPGPLAVAIGAGAVAGSGAVADEKGDGNVHVTTITLTDRVVTMTDATTAGNHGTSAVYTFPFGNIVVLGASCNLTTAAGTGGIADTAALVGSVGSVAVGTDNATLTSTEADIIPSTAGTLSSGAGVLKGESTALAAIDNTTTGTSGTAKTAKLNLAVPDAGTSGNDTITVNGTITLVWINAGDN